MIFIAIPLALLLLATLLLRRGWHGQTVGDHPTCRRCGFDLFGLPRNSTACSECGTDLSPPNTIRTGHLHRRHGHLGAGALLLLIATAWLIVTGIATYSDLNLQPYKPAWWLSREARGPDPITRDAALAEITSRLTAGNLAQPHVDSIADHGLELQRDPSKTWNPLWGDWIELVQANGRLSTERWQRYLDQAFNIQFTPRPQVRRGDLLPYQLNHPPARLGKTTTLHANFKTILWQIDAETLPDSSYGGGFPFRTNDGSGFGRALDLTPLLPTLKDGPHTVRATLDLQLDQNGGPIIGSAKRILTGTFDLHPETSPTVHLIHDPALRPAVEKAITISQAEFAPRNPSKLFVTVQLNHTPVGLSYEVSATADGKSFKLGQAAAPAGTHAHGWGFVADVPGLSSPTIDILFKPTPTPAANTTDTFEIWDAEILIRNVKIR
jgi:hypothetical protein